MSIELHLEAPWPEVKDRLQEVNHDLTDSDLAYEPGKEMELLSRVSEKMNKEIEEIKGWIESVSANKRIAY